MAQNIYDDDEFFQAYGQLDRSRRGLDGAPEWATLRGLVPPLLDASVVDLGCGLGWFTRWAADAGATSVMGIDVSERMLTEAAERTESTAVSYRHADLETLELPTSTFDLAYSSLALHYVSNLASLVATVFHSLRPGGVFVFSCEHPIFTATTDQAFVASPDGRAIWPLSGYQREGQRVTHWLAPGVVKYHRTVGTIFHTLVDAGFTVETLIEWRPSDEQLAEHPAWDTELDRPGFLIMRSRR